jgi:hypothetical protein
MTLLQSPQTLCYLILSFFNLFLLMPSFYPYNKVRDIKVLHIVSLVFFWTSECVKCLLIILVTWINFDILR